MVAGHKDPAGIGACNGQDAFGKRETGDYFGGLIDDVRIYDNALSVEEIKVLSVVRPATAAVQPEREKLKAELVESKPEKPRPAEVRPSTERLLKRNTIYIGPELYSFKYEEPGYMEEEGTFYGIAIGTTYREWVPYYPGQALPDNKMMFRAEGRFAFGQVDYDGAVQDLETGEIYPYSVDNQNDFVLEGRLMLGPEWLGENILSTLYSGLGYRYLNDDSSSSSGGYERESNYFYIPIGYEINTGLRAGWSIAGRIEYDYFLWGMQRSHLSNVGLLDVDNMQDSGYGYRASIRFQKVSTDAVFVIEPFLRYWDIDDSDLEYAGYGYYVLEPANNTTELGVQLIWMF